MKSRTLRWEKPSNKVSTWDSRSRTKLCLNNSMWISRNKQSISVSLFKTHSLSSLMRRSSLLKLSSMIKISKFSRTWLLNSLTTASKSNKKEEKSTASPKIDFWSNLKLSSTKWLLTLSRLRVRLTWTASRVRLTQRWMDLCLWTSSHYPLEDLDKFNLNSSRTCKISFTSRDKEQLWLHLNHNNGVQSIWTKFRIPTSILSEKYGRDEII